MSTPEDAIAEQKRLHSELARQKLEAQKQRETTIVDPGSTGSGATRGADREDSRNVVDGDDAGEEEMQYCEKTGEPMSCLTCKNPYDMSPEGFPKLLDCFHTYCTACIEDMTTAEDGSAKVPAECPRCQTTTRLKDAASTDLTTNFVIMNELLIAMNITVTQWCGLCEDRHHAVYYCQECDAHMCQNAHVMHGRFNNTKNHAVVKTAKGKCVKPPALLTCSIHEMEKTYLVESTNELICMDCLALNMTGTGPAAVSVDQIIGKEREEMSRIVGKSTQQLAMYTQSISDVRQMIVHLEDAAKKTTEQIENYFQNVIAKLLERKSELQQEVMQMKDEKTRVLTNQLDILGSSVLAVSSGCGQLEYVAAKERPARAIQVKQKFIGALKIIDDKKIPILPLVDDDFTFVPDVELPNVARATARIDTTSFDHSVATGQGTKSLSPGVSASFLIIAKDASGQQRTIGGDQFEVNFSFPTEAVAIVDNGDGTYKVSYTYVPSVKEAFGEDDNKEEVAEDAEDDNSSLEISVKLRGRDILGSPYRCLKDVRLSWNKLNLNLHPAGKDGNMFAGNGLSRDPKLIANAWAKLMGFKHAVKWDVKIGGTIPAVYHFEKLTPLDKVVTGETSCIKFSSSYRGSDPVVFNVDCAK